MDEEIKELLKGYVTRDELQQVLTSQRSASEQFLEDHDRNFRDLERNLNSGIANLNAGLSKLNIMSDALSQVMRVMQDNYEAIRSTQRLHEDRLTRLETSQATQYEEQQNFYAEIFGDSQHPDKESIVILMKNRAKKADAQHEAMMSRLEILEEQMKAWQKLYQFALSGIGNGAKALAPKLLKWGLLAVLIPTLARIVDAPLLDQIGVLFRWYVLGIR